MLILDSPPVCPEGQSGEEHTSKGHHETMKKLCEAASGLIALACLLLLTPSGGSAQLLEHGVAITPPPSATPAYYTLAKPGELTMQVNVWGYITHPGRYEISITTDLVQLISLAGGPIADADMSQVRVTRFLKTDVGISRGQYVVDLHDLYRVNEANLILQPGDTIMIDQTSWVGIRDIIGVVTSVAVITVSVATVYQYTRPK